MTKREIIDHKEQQGISVIFILLFIAIVLGGAMYFVWTNTAQIPSANTSNNDVNVTDIKLATILPTPTPTPKPTIYPLIPDNGSAGTYQVSQPAHAGPVFRQVVFNPLDVAKDQNLKITVTIETQSSVQSLTGNFQMDSSQKALTFKKVGSQSQKETWEIEFNLPDSVSYKYILSLTAKDSQGTATMSVAPRS